MQDNPNPSCCSTQSGCQGPDAYPQRRSFVKCALAVLFGGAALLAAPITGLRFFTAPLTKAGGGEDKFTKVTNLKSLPKDGVPRKFTVIDTQVDAWTKYPKMPIGNVFIVRDQAGEITCLSDICPHLACGVSLVNIQGQHIYNCPCHDSQFEADGKTMEFTLKSDGSKGPVSISPRALDSLAVKVDDATGDVFVAYKKFKTGRATKEQE